MYFNVSVYWFVFVCGRLWQLLAQIENRRPSTRRRHRLWLPLQPPTTTRAY